MIILVFSWGFQRRFFKNELLCTFFNLLVNIKTDRFVKVQLTAAIAHLSSSYPLSFFSFFLALPHTTHFWIKSQQFFVWLLVHAGKQQDGGHCVFMLVTRGPTVCLLHGSAKTAIC